MLRRGSCQTFFLREDSDRNQDGGKVRLCAVRQNCGSNFSRLARQCELPAVAVRLFFCAKTVIETRTVGRQVLVNEVSVKKLVELRKQRREPPEGENCESNFSESPSNCVAKG